MSHITKCGNVQINSASAIRSAVESLRLKGKNVTLEENAKPRMYAGAHGQQCDLVLRLHDGQYDVGLRRLTDGSYQPEFDVYAGHVGNIIGADVNKTPLTDRSEQGRAKHAIGQFLQEYGVARAKEEALSQGHMVEDTRVDDKGSVHLVIATS